MPFERSTSSLFPPRRWPKALIRRPAGSTPPVRWREEHLPPSNPSWGGDAKDLFPPERTARIPREKQEMYRLTRPTRRSDTDWNGKCRRVHRSRWDRRSQSVQERRPAAHRPPKEPTIIRTSLPTSSQNGIMPSREALSGLKPPPQPAGPSHPGRHSLEGTLFFLAPLPQSPPR